MPRKSHLSVACGCRGTLLLTAVLAAVGLFSPAGVFAQRAPRTLRPAAVEQLLLLAEWKGARTVAERKIDSQLLFALDVRSGLTAGGLAVVEKPALPDDGRLEVDIDLVTGAEPDELASLVRRLGGEVGYSSARFAALRATLPLDSIRSLALQAEVRRIAPARPAFTQRIVSEGDRTHAADTARNLYAIEGGGRKICALSDGVAELDYSQAKGELPAVDVLPGEGGGGSEGTAMLEIVHDLAPGAALGFATAFGGVARFAQNILDLAASGCQVIVDDVFYLEESPFQDGAIAEAVDEVAAQGVLYLSAAGNQGNLADGTSGTWEGDFVPGAALPTLPGLVLHDFGAGGVANLVTRNAPAVTLHWTDPFGTAANDYDLYVLSADLSRIVRFSNNTQDGAGGDDDPVEIVSFFGSGASAGEHLVVARPSGAGRLLNLVAFRGELDQATGGALRGHAAAVGALAVAAAPAHEAYTEGQPAGPYPLEFGTDQQSETFSADGPRRIFFSAQGELLPGAPPGDFSSTGGIVRAKPELAAADGVMTSVEGFAPFFGTSAAAPHAAALAALYWSALPAESAGGVRAALLDAALDIEAPGPDPTTGYGLVRLTAALAAAAVPLRANLELGSVVPVEVEGNGDAVLDPGERFRLDVELVNVGGAMAVAISGDLSAQGAAAVVADATSAWGDLAAGTAGASLDGFEIRLPPDAECGTVVPFALTLLYAGGAAPETLSFALALGAPGEALRFTYDGAALFIADSPIRGEPGPATLATLAIGGLPGRVSDLDFAFDGDLCTVELAATTVGLQHGFVSNLLIELQAPSGAVVPLIRFADGFGNHFCQTVLDDESDGPSIQSVRTGDNPFTGSYWPARPLALFDGEDANGIWTLQVTDWNPIDTGHLRDFSLTVTPAVCRSFVGAAEIPALRPVGLVALSLLLSVVGLRVLKLRERRGAWSHGAEGTREDANG